MRKGDQTRQEIIRKAAPIFNQKGYDGAALSDLMRATGLEKSGIYRHLGASRSLRETRSTTLGGWNVSNLPTFGAPTVRDY